MADSNSSVRIPGIVLGSLMFQHLNSDSDVEGFLLGESKAEEKSNITDSQIDNIQFEHTTNIQKHITCCKLGSFYNTVGHVNKDRLRYVLSDNEEVSASVIGWYKQRRNSDQQMTFKEQIVHEDMKRALSNPELIFLLLTPNEVTLSGSTHRLEYAVFRSLDSRKFHNVPVLVTNLGLLEQQDYWRIPAPCSSVGYNRAIGTHRSKFFSSDGSLQEVEEINRMNESLQDELKRACRDVEKSERLVGNLLADVSALRMTINKKKLSNNKDAVCPTTMEAPENVLLCEAMRVLFPGSVLLQTRALTLQGSPVPELCCTTEHNVDIAATLPLILAQKLPKARKGKLGKGVSSRRKRHLPTSCKDSKKSKSVLMEEKENDSSGSETSDEILTSQNCNLDYNNSPIF
ncbi:BRCA1-A complex subunit Abraxas 1 [Aplochiton taeniatus]